MPAERPLPKVLYLADEYLSHAIAAQAYRDALASLGALTETPDEADIVVYHSEMRRVSSLRARFPALGRLYAVGTLVWETDRLRQKDEAGIRLLDEVWTPTLYSARAIVALHRRVYLLPHVIEAPTEPSAEDLLRIDGWLGPEVGRFNLLALMKFLEPRKNAPALVRAVSHLREQWPALRLIIKVPGPPCDEEPLIEHAPGVVTIVGRVSRASIEALLRRSHAVISAHRAEAWGLTLSDALVRRIPLIASDYSGNRSFMPRDGAYPIICDEARVGEHAGDVPFDPQAIWGAPRLASIEAQIVRALDEVTTGACKERVERGYRAARRYRDKHLRLLLRGRLRDIQQRLDAQPTRNKDR